MIRCIVSDIDGTLLPSGQHELDLQVLELAEQAKQQGVMLTAASGRPYASLKRLWNSVMEGMAFICANGTLIMRDDAVIYETPLEARLAASMMQDVYEQEHCELLVTCPRHCYIRPKTVSYRNRMQNVMKYPVQIIEEWSEIQEEVLQISIFREDGIEKSSSYFENQWQDQAQVMVSGKLWMDMTAPGANKGTALAELLKENQIGQEEAAALGDSYNDIAMFEQVGQAYAMAWSPEAVKNVAGRITDDPVGTIQKLLQEKNEK